MGDNSVRAPAYHFVRSVISNSRSGDILSVSSDPVRFAVVGCGNIGSRHLAILDAFEQATLAAFCDVDVIKLQKYSELYPNVAAYDSIDDLLNHCRVDVVNVCTPHYLHCEHALSVIRRGVHALVEKPMSLTTRDADKMIDAAQRAGVLLMVMKQNRYNLPVVMLREAMEAQRLGRVLLAQCNVVWNRYSGYYSQSPWLGRRALEGGSLFTQVSHFIDLLIWMCGDVVEASGRIETKTHRVEIEDCGTAWLRFSKGAMGTLLWTTSAYNKNVEGSITLVCERGTVKIGGPYLNRVEYWDVEGLPLPNGIEWVDQPNSYGKYQGSSSNHDKVLRDVIRRVRKEDFHVVGGEEARKTIQAIEMIYESCKVRHEQMPAR